MEFTKERLQIWQTIRHKSFTKDVLQNRIHLCLDEIERLQSKLSAYENDLVLLDVTDKLNKAEARVAELEDDLTDQSQKRIEDASKLIDRVLGLEAKIRELEEQQRWIPVINMPEEGQFVEIDFGNSEYTVGLWYWENEPAEWSNGTDYIQWQHWNIGEDRMESSSEPPLRWRPLPLPPKEE